MEPVGRERRGGRMKGLSPGVCLWGLTVVALIMRTWGLNSPRTPVYDERSVTHPPLMATDSRSLTLSLSLSRFRLFFRWFPRVMVCVGVGVAVTWA